MDADAFRKLELSRIRALLERDMELTQQLHASDYELITPTGFVYSREVYLREIEEGLLKYVAWEPGPIEVRVHGDVALLRYEASLEVDSGEESSSSFRCWHTDVYELRDGAWQAVRSQATVIR